MGTDPQKFEDRLRSGAARLQVVEHYAVQAEDNRFFVKTATHSGLLSGRMVREVLPKLLPLLDGSRSFEDIAESLSGTIGRERLSQVLEFLSQKGLVRDVEEPPANLSACDLQPYESMARYFAQGGSRYATLSRLKSAHIGIVNSGAAVPALLSSLAHFGVSRFSVFGDPEIEALEVQQSRYYQTRDQSRERISVWRERIPSLNPQLDIKLVPAGADKTAWKTSNWEEALQNLSMLIVMLQGPLLFPDWLGKLNEAAFALRLPWTSIALLDGESAQLGPTIRPGVTACYKCFETRLKSNLGWLGRNETLDAYLREAKEHVDFGLLPPVADIAAGFAAIEVVRTLSSDSVAQTSGKIMLFNAADFSTEFHPVLKLPRCTVCSPVRNKPQPRIWS